MTWTMNRWYAFGLLTMAACDGSADTHLEAAAVLPPATTYTIRDTAIAATLDATGVAEAVRRATLSTRLIGNVVAVLVEEGDQVRPGAMLVRIDDREVTSRRAQIDASVGAAEAVYQDAVAQVERFRALYRDSAATRYQLEQMETGLARAEAGLKTAQGMRVELDAMGSYAEVRAPFGGIVTRRMVDPGSFAAPGAPLLEVQDPSRLRISVAVPARVAALLRRGTEVVARIEGRFVHAVIEGVVPSGAGTVYTVNALVDNRQRELLPGSAAVVTIPSGLRRAVLLPSAALIREGDLVGVRVVGSTGPELRWLKVGAELPGHLVEVLAGVAAGDVVLLGER